MKRTFTAKITLSGTAVPAMSQRIVESLIINALNSWLADGPDYLLKNRPQLISLHKVRVTAEEIDTE